MQYEIEQCRKEQPYVMDLSADVEGGEVPKGRIEEPPGQVGLEGKSRGKAGVR